jgi:hypothetical protein
LALVELRLEDRLSFWIPACVSMCGFGLLVVFLRTTFDYAIMVFCVVFGDAVDETTESMVCVYVLLRCVCMLL